jgi:hypothetical protein
MPNPLRRFPRPSAPLLLSTAALVVALGGTSYAAIKIDGGDIQKGTVTTKQIKNKTVKGADLKPGTVGSKQVKDSSLQAKDFRPGQIPQGPQGPAGVGRWALINSAGQIEAQSGGFSVTAAYPVLATTGTDLTGLRANGNVYINTGEPLGNNGLIATIALQNTTALLEEPPNTNTNGRAPGADQNAEFSGEITVSQCGLPGTACAPPGTGNVNHLVVSPRNSDGSFTVDGQRKRFYVVVTGDSSDRVS